MTTTSTASRSPAAARAPARALAALATLATLAVCALPARALPAPRPQADAATGARAYAAGEASAPAQGFESAVPASTQIFLGVADLQVLEDTLAAGPWGKLWDDPALAELRTRVEQQFGALLAQANEQAGFDLEAALEGLQGGLALAIDFEGPEDGAPLTDIEDVRLSILILAGLAEDHEALAQVVEQGLAQIAERHGAGNEAFTRRSIEVGDWDVTELHDVRDGRDLDLRAVVTDDLLVLEMAINGAERLTAVLDEHDGEGDGEVLADQPRFKSSFAARTGGGQIWIDFERACEFGQAFIDTVPADHGERDELDFLQRSGLLALQDLAGSSGFDDVGPRFDMHLRWPAGGWLHEALECIWSPGPTEHLSAVQADVKDVMTWRVDFPRLFDLVLKELIASGEVDTADVVGALSSFEAETGFALREDLLESLNGQISMATCEVDPTEALPTGGEPQNFVLLLGVKDGAAFNTLLEDFVRKRGLHAARKRDEFQGFEVFTVPVFPGFAVSYAVLPDMLVASLAPTLVQEVLRRRAGADVPNFAQRKELAPLLARLSPDFGWLTVADSAKNAHTVVSAAFGALAAVGARQPMLAELLAGLEAPGLEVFEKHFEGLSAGAVTVDATGIRMESVQP